MFISVIRNVDSNGCYHSWLLSLVIIIFSPSFHQMEQLILFRIRNMYIYMWWWTTHIQYWRNPNLYEEADRIWSIAEMPKQIFDLTVCLAILNTPHSVCLHSKARITSNPTWNSKSCYFSQPPIYDLRF